MVELHQILYEKNTHNDFSDYNVYYCKNGSIYHRCDNDNNFIKEKKNYNKLMNKFKDKLFRIGNVIVNKIF